MKKFFIVFLVVILSFSFVSCSKKKQDLSPFISELRSNVFEGKSQTFTIKSTYGFRETPFNKDGKVKEKVYLLTFKLLGEVSEQTTYTISFELNNKSYSSEFKLNPVSHTLSASIEVQNFNKNQFSVNVSNGAESQTIVLSSLLPKGTINYQTALSKLEKSQPELIKSFSNNDGFNAEIHLRVIVKDGKSYWYVGFAQPDRLKALLLDGKTGKVLAMREVF